MYKNVFILKNFLYYLTPIVYGLTTLLNGPNIDGGVDFLELFINVTAYEDPLGDKSILKYFNHIFPLVASKNTTWDDIPKRIQPYMVPYSNYKNNLQWSSNNLNTSSANVNRFKSSLINS
jgi:hypothetical protein